MKIKKNLFICLTPYQLFLVPKIIKLEKLEDTTILLINLSHSPKNFYYLNQASQECDCNTIVFTQIHKSKYLKILSYLKFITKSVMLHKFKNLYIASLHDKYIHTLMRFIFFQNLNTFDDGIANINKGGIFFTDTYIKKKILNKICTHYSVFPNVTNIIDSQKIRQLDITTSLGHLSSNNNKRLISIFIGQPYEEFIPNFQKNILEKFLQQNSVNYYFQHPRETEFIESVQYIESEKIFESFLEDFIFENPNYEINLYSFVSTVMFNVSNYPNVKCYALKNNYLYKNYSYLYDLMSQFNIQWIDI